MLSDASVISEELVELDFPFVFQNIRLGDMSSRSRKSAKEKCRQLSGPLFPAFMRLSIQLPDWETLPDLP